MARGREGDEGCDGDAVAEGDLAGDDGGWDLRVGGGWVGGCAGGTVDDWGGRILQHGWHLAR